MLRAGPFDYGLTDRVAAVTIRRLDCHGANGAGRDGGTQGHHEQRTSRVFRMILSGLS